jgi:hypothetical protein
MDQIDTKVQKILVTQFLGLEKNECGFSVVDIFYTLPRKSMFHRRRTPHMNAL